MKYEKPLLIGRKWLPINDLLGMVVCCHFVDFATYIPFARFPPTLPTLAPTQITVTFPIFQLLVTFFQIPITPCTPLHTTVTPRSRPRRDVHVLQGIEAHYGHLCSSSNKTTLRISSMEGSPVLVGKPWQVSRKQQIGNRNQFATYIGTVSQFPVTIFRQP